MTNSQSPDRAALADELIPLPCPFCGTHPHMAIKDYAVIACVGEECFGPRTTAEFLVDAIKQWNTRSPSPYSGARAPKVRTSHHRNKEEAARLQALVDERCATTLPRGGGEARWELHRQPKDQISDHEFLIWCDGDIVVLANPVPGEEGVLATIVDALNKATTLPHDAVSVELLNLERAVADDLREKNEELRAALHSEASKAAVVCTYPDCPCAPPCPLPRDAERETIERCDFRWLIEAPGARYLAVQRLHMSDNFEWTTDHNRALAFRSEEQADGLMMAVRQMDRHINGFDKGLFAFEANLGDAKAIEHGWLPPSVLPRDADAMTVREGHPVPWPLITSYVDPQTGKLRSVESGGFSPQPRDAERETIEDLAISFVSIIQDGIALQSGSKSIASMIINELLARRVIALPSIPPREGPLQSTTEQADASRDHPVREAVARIIDPAGFSGLESERAWAAKWEKPDSFWLPWQTRCNKALAQADAILALSLSPSPTSVMPDEGKQK